MQFSSASYLRISRLWGRLSLVYIFFIPLHHCKAFEKAQLLIDFLSADIGIFINSALQFIKTKTREEAVVVSELRLCVIFILLLICFYIFYNEHILLL